MTSSPRRIKDHVASGKKIIAGWCAIPNSITAEIVARQNFDAVAVDLQHGFMDYQDALALLQVIDAQGHPALCRVPWNEPGIIMKVLDAGFSGIICPMINTRKDAEKFVAACRYAPVGQRSWGPTRALYVHGADYAKTANELVTTFAMIETVQAMENLDEILSVDGVDGIYIGPSDLGLSMGYAPTLEPVDEAVYDAIATIRKAAKAAGKIAGIHCGSPKMVRRMLSEGFDLGTLLTDTRIFASAIAAVLAETRAEDAPRMAGQY
jgi:4-hydroxy-2-oxoheptanedioate aldolase